MNYRNCIFLALFLLAGCPSGKKNTSAKVVVEDYDHSWSGASRLLPKNVTYIVSPSEAYITEFGLGYGREVKKGDSLLVLSDPKIQDDFTNAIIEYLKNKDKVLHDKKKLEGEKEMLKAGILSEDEYWTQQSAHQDSYIAFVKSKLHLQEITSLVGVDYHDIAKIKVSDLSKVAKLLVKKVSVKITAPKSGLLLPRGEADKDSSKPLELGQKLEKGEIAAAIADQGSYKVKVLIPDNFSRVISDKSKASISDNHGLIIKAKIVDFQPYLFQVKDGKRMFPVTIDLILPKPPLLIPDVYVGMPVNVKLVFDHKKYKKLPIQSLGYKDEKYFVEKKDTFGTTKIRVKVVGTDEISVYFIGNIDVGEEVVLHD